MLDFLFVYLPTVSACRLHDREAFAKPWSVSFVTPPEQEPSSWDSHDGECSPTDLVHSQDVICEGDGFVLCDTYLSSTHIYYMVSCN